MPDTLNVEKPHALSEHSKTKLVEADFGLLGKIVLDKPKALNALSTDMIEAMQATLDAWADDDHVKAVWIDGAGDHDFCAGGDELLVYHSMHATDAGDVSTKAHEFLHEEFTAEHTINTYTM